MVSSKMEFNFDFCGVADDATTRITVGLNTQSCGDEYMVISRVDASYLVNRADVGLTVTELAQDCLAGVKIEEG